MDGGKCFGDTRSLATLSSYPAMLVGRCVLTYPLAGLSHRHKRFCRCVERGEMNRGTVSGAY